MKSQNIQLAQWAPNASPPLSFPITTPLVNDQSKVRERKVKGQMNQLILTFLAIRQFYIYRYAIQGLTFKNLDIISYGPLTGNFVTSLPTF